MIAHFHDDNDAQDEELVESLSVEMLAESGIYYSKLPLEGYQNALDALKTERGYVEQDEVLLHSETEGLKEICAKFKDEHHHDDDEVRFVLEGEGIFDLRDDDDEWIRILVEPGDLIVVPKDMHHRFFLTSKVHIRCVRLFKDAAGWAPIYRDTE